MQAVGLSTYTQGRRVWDLGCGQGYLTRWLRSSGGAAQVAGVDKDHVVNGRRPRGVLFDHCHYHKWTPPFDADVAIISWPTQHGDLGLVELLERAPLVAYVGRNDAGVVCGSARLWMHFGTRELLMLVPAPENDLLVFGPLRPPVEQQRLDLETWLTRARCAEERAANARVLALLAALEAEDPEAPSDSREGA